MDVYVPTAPSTDDFISDMSGQVKSSTPSRCGGESDLTESHRQALFRPLHERGKFFTLKHKQTSIIHNLAVKWSHFHITSKQETATIVGIRRIKLQVINCNMLSILYFKNMLYLCGKFHRLKSFMTHLMWLVISPHFSQTALKGQYIQKLKLFH